MSARISLRVITYYYKSHHVANNRDKLYIIHHPTKIKQHQSFKNKPIKRKCITFGETKYITSNVMSPRHPTTVKTLNPKPIPPPNHRQNSRTTTTTNHRQNSRIHHHDQPPSKQSYPPRRPTTVKRGAPTTITTNVQRECLRRRWKECGGEDGKWELRGGTPISNLISQCHQEHPNVLFSKNLIRSHNRNKILFSLSRRQLYAGATNLGLFKNQDSFYNKLTLTFRSQKTYVRVKILNSRVINRTFFK